MEKLNTRREKGGKHSDHIYQPEALAPAIRRRAALDLHFERPSDRARNEIIMTSVPELNLSSEEVAELVHLTGAEEPKNKGIPFTASDLIDRLFPEALQEAYSQKQKLKAQDLLNHARKLEPTPRVGRI